MEDAGEQREAHDGAGGAGGAVPAGSLPLLNSALLGLSGVSDSLQPHGLQPPMGFSRQEYWSGVPLPSPCQSILSFKQNWINPNTSLSFNSTFTQFLLKQTYS